MAAKKKTMGRGLGSLLERRTATNQPSQPKKDSNTPSHEHSKELLDTARPTKEADGTAKADRIAPTPSNSKETSSSSSAQTSGIAQVSGNRQNSSFVQSSGKPKVRATHQPEPVPRSELPSQPDLQAADVQAATPSGDKLRLLGIDQIKRGTYQPRRHFDPKLLQELADSLKSEGLIQPILVRPDGLGNYELIGGERRWRAAQLAGFTDISAIVRDIDDREAAAVSLIENIQRKDLNPMEEAEALSRLSEEFGLSHQEVATSVGRSRSAVSNLMRLLDLHEDAKALVDEGQIDMGHARALLGAPIDEQPVIARQIAKEGLTVRAVEKQIKLLRAGEPAKPVSETVVDPDIDRLEKHLTEKLGAKVSIRHKKSGSGKLEIRYHSMDALDGILNHFK